MGLTPPPRIDNLNPHVENTLEKLNVTAGEDTIFACKYNLGLTPPPHINKLTLNPELTLHSRNGSGNDQTKF